MEYEINDISELESRHSSPDTTDSLGIYISLDSVTDEILKRFCREANIAYIKDHETAIEILRVTAKNNLAEKSYQPYHNEGDEDEHLGPFVNNFTPINKPRSRTPIEDPEDDPKDALAPLGVHVSRSLIDWTAPSISAAAIRRECVARKPSIYVPAKLLARKVKAEYGPILMELDRNARDNIPRLGRQRSLPPKKRKAETQSPKEIISVRHNLVTRQRTRQNMESRRRKKMWKVII